MATKRNIQYINKDFTELRASLVNYAKTYFPTTYNDFTPASPGMMFMEMAAYVGDVLSFYLDNQFQETYLQYARQTNNLYELAYMFGYKPNVTQVATALMLIFINKYLLYYLVQLMFLILIMLYQLPAKCTSKISYKSKYFIFN